MLHHQLVEHGVVVNVVISVIMLISQLVVVAVVVASIIIIIIIIRHQVVVEVDSNQVPINSVHDARKNVSRTMKSVITQVCTRISSPFKKPPTPPLPPLCTACFSYALINLFSVNFMLFYVILCFFCCFFF